MACGCQKTTTGGTYLYVNEDGVSSEHPSEIEARAAMVRNGNLGFVKKA